MESKAVFFLAKHVCGPWKFQRGHHTLSKSMLIGSVTWGITLMV